MLHRKLHESLIRRAYASISGWLSITNHTPSSPMLCKQFPQPITIGSLGRDRNISRLSPLIGGCKPPISQTSKHPTTCFAIIRPRCFLLTHFHALLPIVPQCRHHTLLATTHVTFMLSNSPPPRILTMQHTWVCRQRKHSPAVLSNFFNCKP